jgi:hypothetical protein
MNEKISAIDAADPPFFSITRFVNTNNAYVAVTDKMGNLFKVEPFTTVINLIPSNWTVPIIGSTSKMSYAINGQNQTYLCIDTNNQLQYGLSPTGPWMPLTGNNNIQPNIVISFDNNNGTYFLADQNINGVGIGCFDGYQPVITNFQSIADPIAFKWRGELISPNIIAATYSTKNDNFSNISIIGSVYLPQSGLGSATLACTRNGGMYSPLIYKIRYQANTTPIGETKLQEFRFTITDMLELAVDDPTTGNVFVTVFLENEDPKTSRGTVTTIIKSS